MDPSGVAARETGEFKDPGLLCGEPQRSRQAHVQGRSLQWNWRRAVFHQRGDLFSSAEICLVHDAGLAVNACAFDDIVVELVGLLLGDKGRHIG